VLREQSVPIRDRTRDVTVSTEPTLPITTSAADIAVDSLNLVGSGVKVLLHAIKNLERNGIDTSVPLPKIVVVGDQSAGKSSLIEAIR
jgi:hypothetical protein